MQIEAWEHRLLARANEAIHMPVPLPLYGAGHVGRAETEEAFAFCARVVRANSRTFFLASSLLPEPKRRAARALYAFCRATDDLIDETPPGADVDRLLASWQARLAITPTVYDPVPLAWSETKTRYQIPHGYETQLIEGIARDLRQTRYATFAELAEYCYGVASTVGLMVMHIIGFERETARRFAVKLGIALQLTNILRDVGVDWRAGRLYLPLDELARFGLSELDVASEQVDGRWRSFMRFQIARARALFAEAAPGIALLSPDGRFAITAAADLYEAILGDIERHDFDVFHHRGHISAWGKAWRIPGLWLAARSLRPAVAMELVAEDARHGAAPAVHGD